MPGRIRSSLLVARVGGALLGDAIFFSLAGAVRAQNSLTLSTDTPAAFSGEPVVLTLSMNFADTTVGGAVTVKCDAGSLLLNSILFDGGLADDPDFRCPGSSAISCPIDPNSISFGSVSGLSGSATVATLHFTRLSSAPTLVALSATSAFGAIGGSALSVSMSGIESGTRTRSTWRRALPR